MVARTLISLAWNCSVFDEHFELPQKTLPSLLTYRLRPFYRKAQLLSLSLLASLNSELKEVTG